MQDERLKRAPDAARQSRAVDDRAITESREYADMGRYSMRVAMGSFAVLPDPGELPGYKLIWLSTTNQQDPVQSRMRLGYTPVTPEEMPGFSHESLKSAAMPGCIGVNEMVLFKLPTELWERYMREMYHDAPAEEEQRLYVNAQEAANQVQARGGRVEMGDGFTDMNRPAPSRPRFS